MKKLLIFATIITLCLSLFAGCASGTVDGDVSADNGSQNSSTDNSSKGDDAEESIDDEELEESDEVVEETGLVFGDIDSLGNNPNNLVQCPAGMVFDDDYIYFADHSAGSNSISRIHYDGTGYEVLPISDAISFSSHDSNMFLNLKDGYLYYCAQGRNINRYELATGNTETVLSVTTSYDINNMLVVDSYLYVSIDMSPDVGAYKAAKNAEVIVVNLETLEEKCICTLDEIANAPVITSNGKDVYFVCSSSSVRFYSVDVSAIQESFSTGVEAESYVEKITLGAGSNNYLTRVIALAKNGFILLTTDKSKALLCTEATGVYYSTGESLGILGSFGDDTTYNTDYATGIGRRFVIGNSYILLAIATVDGTRTSSVHEIVIYKDMDLENPETVYTTEGYWDYCTFGVHDDTLYFIEFETKDGPLNLISVNEDGAITSIAIGG
ncbi:MAG: DUF5050 domain-containing protein [Oscillospiraceae bacterium]|nr:DUF5050 domain-containing protein [Oscillospiraceae bacterium]